MNLNRLILVFGLVVLAPPALSQEGPGILQIFEQFVASSAAASRCIKPEKETLTRFLANFQMVTVLASQELAKRYPQRTKEQIATAMKENSDLITERVFGLVQQKGCDHPDTKEAVKRFYVQAQWQPGKK